MDPLFGRGCVNSAFVTGEIMAWVTRERSW